MVSGYLLPKLGALRFIVDLFLRHRQPFLVDLVHGEFERFVGTLTYMNRLVPKTDAFKDEIPDCGGHAFLLSVGVVG